MAQSQNSNFMGENFPFLSVQVDKQPLIYFDNAATSQKPESVIDAIAYYYRYQNANVHRASHYLSAQATASFEAARAKVKQFIGAAKGAEIIWTKGTTEAMNLVAHSWALSQIQPGDEVVVSIAEHHANFVPWQMLCKQVGAKLVIAPLTKTGLIDINLLPLSDKTKLVAVHHVSNVVGKVNDIATIAQKVHQVGAKLFIDGAQSVAHVPIDVQQSDCDFFAFSGHKMFGPTGIGVLYVKEQILKQMQPYQFGGEMIKQVLIEDTEFNELPFLFEAGTPNIAGAIGLAKSCQMLMDWQQHDVQALEQRLTTYLFQALAQIPQLKFVFDGQPDIPLFSFYLEGHANHDVAAFLDSRGIAVRAGHHCAMPLMQSLNVAGLIRVSLAPYNTIKEIDYLITVLQEFLAIDNVSTKSNDISPKREHADFVSCEQIKTLLQACKSWDQKHREIMLLGKNFPRLAKTYCTEQNAIKGCESQAWLQADYDAGTDLVHLQGDSNARVIRGLLHIVFSVYDKKTPQQILATDINVFFEDLGLLQHISPSRGNGLLAIVKKINEIAEQLINQ